MAKGYQFDPNAVFPVVAQYIREGGKGRYIKHRELVALLMGDQIIDEHFRAMRSEGYEGELKKIVPKMVGYFSKCWTDEIGYDMTEYKKNFRRKRIGGRYAYQLPE